MQSAGEGYQPLPTRTVKVTFTIPNLATNVMQQASNYKTLRLYNPWVKDYSLTVAQSK